MTLDTATVAIHLRIVGAIMAMLILVNLWCRTGSTGAMNCLACRC